MRDDAGKKREFNPLPFGFGVRMCIGWRMAEALIYTSVDKQADTAPPFGVRRRM